MQRWNENEEEYQRIVFERSEIELDWLTINGDMYNFNARKNKDRAVIKKYLENMGLQQTKCGFDWVLYESDDGGMSAFFSNYPSNNKKLPFRPNIKIDFKGHFFIHQNAVLLARKITLWFLNKFGVYPSVSRVDLRQDIYGATTPFDYFPDFTDNQRHHWALRSSPEVNHYTNGFSRENTGFSVRTSRYDVTSYDRQLSLEKKFAQGKVSKAYYDYYINIYQERPVQRLEVRLKHDACDTFQHFFLHESFEQETIYKYTLANFGRNHAIKDLNLDNPYYTKNLKVNEVFSELFYMEEKENFKSFRSELEERTNIKLADMTFKKEGKSQESMSRMFAKKICQTHSPLIIEQFLTHTKGLPDMIINELTTHVEEFKTIEDDRLERFKKTLLAFDLSEEEMEEARQAILSDKNWQIAFHSKVAA